MFRQIELRANWDESQNVPPEEIELTTEEANIYQMSMPKPDIRIEELDKAMGVKYEPNLKKDKYGNMYFKSTPRSGGFYCLG